MRVISGKYKGRVLDYEINGTRPTMDRVKESLFAMIQDYVPKSFVLDLFAGCGNLGIEALSEGASFCYFVDSNKKAINVVKKNIDNIGINNYELLNCDYKNALNILVDKKFNLIFLDPPYDTNYIEEALKLIISNNLLEDKGIIVCESNHLNKIIYPECLIKVKEKKYGDKYIVLLQKV